MTFYGRVEVCSTHFVVGWASVSDDGDCVSVYARLGSRILGFSVADQSRGDLDAERAVGNLNAFSYIIPFRAAIPTDQADKVEVFIAGLPNPLPYMRSFVRDRFPVRQLFILGSPRSGTSQLGATLVETLQLPWTGEAHVAPNFRTAADALRGDLASNADFARLLANHGYRQDVIAMARRAYYQVHNSASFVDKTPGFAMVKASLFAQECFPEARFIFVHRDPVSNIQSRLAKFGGDFEEHCADWAAAMGAWQDISPLLDMTLTIKQADMLAEPHEVAKKLARFVGAPERQESIAQSLATQRTEYTGAGTAIGRIEDTDWSATQQEICVRLCRSVAREYGYLV